jgi:hypothetical protein
MVADLGVFLMQATKIAVTRCMPPGQMALIRMPSSPVSLAADQRDGPGWHHDPPARSGLPSEPPR